MKLKLVLLWMLVIVCTGYALGSTPPKEEWSQFFGGLDDDIGYSVHQTSDSGFIICGFTSSYGAGGGDIWLIKTDSEGYKEWSKTFGGTDEDSGYSVHQTSDGGFIITGETFSYGAGGSDIWLIKTNSLGNEMWSKTFGGSDDEMGESVQQTANGGFIISGETFSYGAGGSDAWLIKTDSLGNEIWSKTFGGSKDDYGFSVQRTYDNGFIIAGWTESYGAGGRDVWLIKTDSEGNEMWSKTFGGSEDDRASSIQLTTDNGFIIAGKTSSYGSGGSDVWLIKTDSEGNEMWSKTFGGSEDDWGVSIQLTTDNGFVITGWTESYGAGGKNVWLIKTDSEGNEKWSKTFEGSEDDYGESVQQTADGGFIIAGKTYSYGDGDIDVWLIKVQPE